MAVSVGATDYLVKPPEQIELIARVRSHFRQYLDRKERDAALQELQSAQQELERMNEELKKLSLTDALTSVPNRRYFDESMEREFSRAQRDQHEISVIMIDIDNFKKYNDSYGHLEGDSCLQLVAKAMSDAVKRPTDTIARYGGEEFSILLPETPLEGAKEVAEVVRAAVEALGIEHKENPPGVVTVSLGVATVIPDNENINKPVSFVNLADKALYNAKETGRNRFVAAGD
ncbi:diguanylate cyclase [Candidatus Reidiella endopervernicosa]|uniref:diguanylate cyclase n=1 Tax=Candidatus Reidiella endopervernicosa TaxID=2738883 RepID=A0A6N0HWG6_9GAMM|nr:diguanylate cyclase [Candidatus Reidiella endopervernicosa]QKQ26710.1 diguanylate cyclase [Candidatus Reidiella endopervernicosa]